MVLVGVDKSGNVFIRQPQHHDDYVYSVEDLPLTEKGLPPTESEIKWRSSPYSNTVDALSHLFGAGFLQRPSTERRMLAHMVFYSFEEPHTSVTARLPIRRGEWDF